MSLERVYNVYSMIEAAKKESDGGYHNGIRFFKKSNYFETFISFTLSGSLAKLESASF